MVLSCSSFFPSLCAVMWSDLNLDLGLVWFCFLAVGWFFFVVVGFIAFMILKIKNNQNDLKGKKGRERKSIVECFKK